MSFSPRVHADIASRHEFSVTSGFGYYGGCDGAGADCTCILECEDYALIFYAGTYNGCPQAMYNPNETYKQVGCSTDNVRLSLILPLICYRKASSKVNLAITFCD